jgi:hypothetical protein
MLRLKEDPCQSEKQWSVRGRMRGKENLPARKRENSYGKKCITSAKASTVQPRLNRPLLLDSRKPAAQESNFNLRAEVERLPARRRRPSRITAKGRATPGAQRRGSGPEPHRMRSRGRGVPPRRMHLSRGKLAPRLVIEDRPRAEAPRERQAAREGTPRQPDRNTREPRSQPRSMKSD